MKLAVLFCVLALALSVNAETFNFPSWGTVYPGVQTQYYLITVSGLGSSQACVLTPKDVSGGGQSVTFNPTSLSYDSQTQEAAIRFKATGITTLTIEWTTTAMCTSPGNITIPVSLRPTFISALQPASPYVKTPTAPIQIWTEIYPTSSITIIPQGSVDLTFSPPSITFDTTTRTGFFTITSSTDSNYNVTFTKTGSDSNFYDITGLTINTFTVQRKILNPVVFPTGNLIPKLDYNLWFDADFPPGTDLDVILRGVDFAFSGSSIQIAGQDTATNFTLRSEFVTFPPDRLLSFQVGGTNKPEYPPLADTTLTFVQRTLTFSNPPDSLYAGQTVSMSVYSHPPPPIPITIRVVGKGLAFPINRDGTISLSPTSPSAVFSVAALNSNSLFPWDQNTYTATMKFVVLDPSNADIYAKPADISIQVKRRDFQVSAVPSNIDVGTVSAPISVSIPSIDAGVTLTPISTFGAVSFTPSTLIFDSTSATQSFTFNTTDTGSFTIQYIVGGAKVFTYTQPAGSSSINVQKRTFSITSTNYLTVKSTGNYFWVSVSNPPPESVSLTPQAPDMTFNPAKITFTPTVSSVAVLMTATANTPFSPTINFALTGANSNLYAPPSLSQSVIRGDIYIDSINPFPVGQSDPIFVELSNLPLSKLTLTPSATGLKFIPSSLSFDPALGQTSDIFTIYADTPRTSRIHWKVSDTGAFNLPSAIDVTVNQRSLSVQPGGNFIAGIANTVLFSVEQAPSTDLTITLTGDADISPASAKILAGDKTATFFVTANNTGTLTLDISVTGPEAAFYNYPTRVDLSVSLRSISVNVFTNAELGSSARAILALDTPTWNGLTVTPSSAVLSFTPATLVFAKGQSTLSFKVTSLGVPGTIGNGLISYTLSGADSAFYNVPAISSVQITPRIIFTQDFKNFDGTSQFLTGVASPTWGIWVSTPPKTSVTVTPTCDFATFSPSSFTFTPTTHSLTYTFTPTKAAVAKVTWAVSGPDAHLYNVDDSHVVTEFRAINNLKVDLIPATNVGVQSAVINVKVQEASFEAVTLQPTGSVVFEPRFLVLTQAASSGTFKITPIYGNQQQPITFKAKHQSSSVWYALDHPSIKLNTTAIVISNTFGLGYPKNLKLNSAVKATFTVSSAPPTGVGLVPYGTNIVFNPPIIFFTPSITSVQVDVTARYDTTANTHDTPWTVYYDLVGQDTDKYLIPANSILWASA